MRSVIAFRRLVLTLAAALLFLVPPAVAVASPPARVVLLLPQGGFRAIDNAALQRSFGIYLQAYDTIRVEAPAATATRTGALAAAEKHSARFAVWFEQRAAGGTRELAAHLVDKQAPDVSALSFSVRYRPKPEPAFYRQVGLKLDSLLRVASMSASEADRPSQPPPPRPDKPPIEPPLEEDPLTASEEAWPYGRPALQLLARGGLPVKPLRFVPAFGGQFRWDAHWWSLGAGALRALADSREADTGTGVAATTQLMASAGFRLVEPWGDVVAPWAIFEIGALLASVDGELTATGESKSTTDVVPYATVGALAGFHIGSHFAVFLGPSVDLAPLRSEVLVRGEQVYASGWIQPNIELRIQGAL